MSHTYDLASDVIRRVYEKRIDAPAILDAATEFPNAAKFTNAWRDIRDEALGVHLGKVPRFHDIMPEQADISARSMPDWRISTSRPISST